jgi:hypothetical protein
MEPETIQAIAGFTSTVIFTSSKLPMLLKAFTTRDLRSYSLGHIALSNSGNAIYWLYVFGLPFGPIWFLQGFFTVADMLMLLCYIRYQMAEGSGRAVNGVPSSGCKVGSAWLKPATGLRLSSIAYGALGSMATSKPEQVDGSLDESHSSR